MCARRRRARRLTSRVHQEQPGQPLALAPRAARSVRVDGRARERTHEGGRLLHRSAGPAQRRRTLGRTARAHADLRRDGVEEGPHRDPGQRDPMGRVALAEPEHGSTRRHAYRCVRGFLLRRLHRRLQRHGRRDETPRRPARSGRARADPRSPRHGAELLDQRAPRPRLRGPKQHPGRRGLHRSGPRERRGRDALQHPDPLGLGSDSRRCPARV